VDVLRFGEGMAEYNETGKVAPLIQEHKGIMMVRVVGSKGVGADRIVLEAAEDVSTAAVFIAPWRSFPID
jgi:hypothetical protein